MNIPAMLAFVATAFAVGTAAAQPNPLVRPLPPNAAGTETLAGMLRGLGYTPKGLSPDVLQITAEKEKWPVHMMLSLSTDGQRIWMECKFSPIDDPDRVPPAAWRRLLEANERVGPAHFAFEKEDRRIHLYKAFDNQNLNVDRLRREIDHFDLTIRKTQDVWRADNFKPALAELPKGYVPLPTVKGDDAPKVEIPARVVSREKGDLEVLLADWRVTEITARGRKTPEAVLAERRPSVRFRPARDVGSLAPQLEAELQTGPGSSRTVAVHLGGNGLAKHIDFTDDSNRVERGIYKIDGDELTMCFAAPGEPRPTTFVTDDSKRQWTIVLRKR